MGFIVNVTLLRKAGARLDKLDPPCEGLLLTEQDGAFIGLKLISYTSAITMAGPLYDARVVRADQDSFVLLGFERDGAASHVQEWQVRPSTAGWATAWPDPSKRKP